ncbi:MAG TPA: hypothetical protein VF167_02925 [Longimicrobiaceae bacterium]
MLASSQAAWREVESLLRGLPGAVEVRYGTARTWGAREVADVALFEEAQVYGVEDTVSIATGSLTVPNGATITVDGESRKVMMPPQRQKGGTTLLALGNA